MADDVDVANDYLDTEVSRAVGRIRQNAAGTPGRKTCAHCGGNIPAPRRKLGFLLCVECATENERRQALFTYD